MTATNLTASIAGTIYPVLNTTYGLDDKVDERSAVRLSFYDPNASYAFQFGQPVMITDTLEGIKFTGFVMKPVTTKYDGQAALNWTVDCADNEFLAGKKTSNRIITNQFAGVAAASMVNDHLSQDGVTANYALRDDNSQSDFNQGTLAGTTATSNLGGDLELAPAGSTVTILENTTAAFSTGGLQAVTASNNSLIPTSAKAIRMQCTQTGVGQNNTYTYVKIFQPAGTFTVVSTRYLFYYVWIDPTSPDAKFGVDITFTDNTTLRDNFTTGEVSQNNLSPHPNTDLSGYADQGVWYGRTFDLTSFAGKNIAYVSIACEGDKAGTYTAWFKSIQYLNSDFSNNQYFFQNSLNVSPPQQLQNQGYESATITVVDTYDCSVSERFSPSYDISAVNILKSSFITWKSTEPANTSVVIKYSLDSGNSYTQCTNNAALPDLPAGSSLSSTSIIIVEELKQFAGANPENPPSLNSIELVVYPSYAASKADVTYSATVSTAWQNTGTFTNTQVSGLFLQLAGATRYWDDNQTNNDMANMTLMGGGATGPNTSTSCYHYVNKKQLSLQVYQSTEARSRMDFAGQIADGTLEFDVYIDNSSMKNGCFYRTTGTSNYDAQYAYAVEISGTTIALQKGSNSNATSNGTRTQIASATINLTSQATHHVKVIFSGSSHTIYFDDVQVISVTDSTYTSAGYCGFRVSNGSASSGYIAYFDNFGVVKALSGTWQSNNISLTTAGTYGTSSVYWEDYSLNPQSTSLLVEATINGGSTWLTCTNGQPLPNFSNGQSLSGVNLKFRVTLTTATATSMPQIRYLIARVCGSYSSSGTRISPVLSLANAIIAGSTVVNWTATTPTNTSVAVSTSLNGTSYSSATNGGAIAGITTQPSPTLDTFDSNSSPNYLQTIRTGGSAGVFFWDTLNSCLSVSGGTNAVLLLTGVSAKDTDKYLDFDQADQAGLVWRWVDASNFYELDIFDASSSTGTINKIRLFKVVSNVKTQIGSDVAVTLTRGYKYRLHLTMVGTAITVSIDGVSLISTTDSSITAAGKVGIMEATGVGRFYNFRVQPQGDNLSGVVVYSKVTLTSTDPTVTPQLTDLTVAALHPNIGLGSLIPTADYTNTYLSDNFNDLAKKSDYTTYIDQNLNFIFNARVAQPAPWILQSADPYLLKDGPLTVDYSADLYRNEMILDGVVATGTKSETKIGDGTATSWALGGEIISPPLVYLNNQLKTIGIKGIDTGKDFYYTPGSNAIDQDASGTILVKTDTLLFQNYTYRFITSITVDNTNLPNTVTQKQFAKIMGRSFAIQNLYSSASSAHTVSGDIGDIDVSKCRRIAVDVNITAVSGTSPTIQFFADRKDVNGFYYQIWSSNVVSAISPVSTTIGAFGTINQSLGSIARLRWTIGGTTPSFTFSISIIGTLDVQSAGLGIVAVVEDVSSQNLDIAAATAYANTLLSRYGTNGRTITFKTWRRNPSLAIGQYLPVFLPEFNINDASMLITGISTTQSIGSEGSNPTQIYWQQATITENANMGSAWKLLSSTLK